MRLSASAVGLFLFAIFFATDSQPVYAAELPRVNLVKSVLSEEIQDPINQPLAKASKPPEPKVHVVTSDETLSKIAKIYDTTWQRLFAKNSNIENPDIVSVNDKITIPFPDEVLVERLLPEMLSPDIANTETAKPARGISPSTPAAPRGSTSGNGYSPGYCTFYAKQRRPDLPNRLGNADTWLTRAAAQGLSTGSTPRVGAIGQRGMHVVFVEAVNADGTVLVSEMNYAGYGVVSSRTVAGSTFSYIY